MHCWLTATIQNSSIGFEIYLGCGSLHLPCYLPQVKREYTAIYPVYCNSYAHFICNLRKIARRLGKYLNCYESTNINSVAEDIGPVLHPLSREYALERWNSDLHPVLLIYSYSSWWDGRTSNNAFFIAYSILYVHIAYYIYYLSTCVCVCIMNTINCVTAAVMISAGRRETWRLARGKRACVRVKSGNVLCHPVIIVVINCHHAGLAHTYTTDCCGK